MNRFRGILLLVLCSGLQACSRDLPADWGSLQWLQRSDTLAQSSGSALTVQFLGAGGIFLHYRDQSLLGDPFFSNPPIAHWLMLRDLKPRADVIDRHLPPLDQVQGILVGHGHFDHAMDVPYIAGKLPDRVKIYGSDSTRHLLTPQLPVERLVGLDARMARNQIGGEWIYLSPQLRILPIYSEHAPHVANLVLGSGNLQHPLQKPPGDVLDWKAGVNLNYVIDFLDPAADGGLSAVAYRLFYQSSASSAPIGFPPVWLLEDGVPFDLALLCAANYSHVADYPQGVLGYLRPRQVVLIHWEQFWDDYSTTSARPMPGVDFADLEQRIRAALGDSIPVRVPPRGGSFELERRS